MRKIRLYLAVWVAKLAFLAIRLMKRQGSHMPGYLALKVFPDLLAHLAKPKRIIVVTGTNGKTTVVNLLAETLAGEGLATIDNRLGSNTDAGVASALIQGVYWWGRTKADVAILEMDERSARRILPGVRPEFLVCTNLTRDSVKRNAHPEYIAWIISGGITPETTLVLNADDLICARIGGVDSRRVLFGIDRLPSDTTTPSGVARDLAICPNCDAELVWDYWRFNHIGHAHCPSCDFASPQADYRVTAIDRAEELVELDLDGRAGSARLLNDALVNVYNQIAVMAVLDRFGVATDRILAAFDHLSVPATRYSAQMIGEVTLVRQLTKGVVGVACSRAFEHIAAAPGPKALVMNIDELTDIRSDCENICWTYDADYEYLADPSLRRIVIGGVRRYDQALRLAIAGVDPKIMTTVAEERAGADLIDLTGMARVYNLHSVHNTVVTGDFVQARLLQRLREAS
ncbi:MAG: MurT ligase domain-containing protein [Propionibacteriaceae bacterium]|nr:MurT ligase domain-containing protein [Propionibacteriaceae bacterium]